jgi:hypothetical protein
VRKTTYPFLLAVIVAVFGALVSAGFVGSAQNTNSSTTMTNSNTNASKPRRPRRPRPRPSPTPEATTDTSGMANTAAATTPPRTGRCDPNKQEPADLSGTYTGKMQHGDDVRDATLTISGNNITVTSGSDTHTGRITAVTTCGYTAVTIMHGDGGTSAPGTTSPPNKVVSLRAKKVGDSLTLMSVPGEPEKVMFTSGGGAGRPRRQGTRRTTIAPKVIETSAPDTTMPSTMATPKATSDCDSNCAAQSGTCRRGCDGIADEAARKSCWRGCDNGYASCVRRCGQ